MEMDDDSVVKEIPVFLCKTLADKLFLVQYPIEPGGRNCEDVNYTESSIKPENQEIRLELEINTESSHYNSSKGAQIALNAKSDHKGDDEEIFNSELMDKITMTSSRTVTNCSNWAIGVFQDNELHITPLKGIVQMQPQYDYLEKSDKRSRDEAKAGEDGDEDEDNPAPVKVTFARHQPDHLKKIQEQSFQHQYKKSLDERWIHTKYVSPYEMQAELTRMEMFCPSTEASVNSLNISTKQYADCLLTMQPSEEQCAQVPQNHTMSLCDIKSLPLLDKIRTIMKDARIMSFANLRAILSLEQDTAVILKYLQQVAVLVQGNWVVNSELIYPKDSYSSQSGIPAEIMCKARDYILLLFTEQQYLDRKTMSTVIKLPPAEIKEIFENLGTHEPQKGWQLIVPPNWDFCDRYPEITQRQAMFWDAKRKYLRDAMEAQSQPPQRQRRKSNRESLGSENEERNVGRGRKSLRDSSLSDDGANEPIKPKKTSRSRKVSETTTT